MFSSGFCNSEAHVTDLTDFYSDLLQQLEGLLAGERDAIANAANTAALLFQELPDLNWAGFYFLRANDELVLGPFQGKPACVRIARGRGVCGAAVLRKESIRVADVHAFADHIACDHASQSELVVPLLKDGAVIGVLDLDSPRRGRFTPEDEAGLVRVAEIFVAASDALFPR
jgi:GAF domain-containing protein